MFKDKIKIIREKHNLTQEEFAGKIFVSRTAVSKWETGKGYPSLDALKQISSLFDVSLDELISDEDISTKKKLDQKGKNEKAVAIIAILLVVALLVGGMFFRKSEIMHYSADSAMRYGLKGMVENLYYTGQALDNINPHVETDIEEFTQICQKLQKDMYYFTEVVASFDYGVSDGYNDYDCIDFYAYISTVAVISNNFDNMTKAEITDVYDSLKKVCKEFNQFNWFLPATDNYIGHDLEAYDFKKDPDNVREHIRKIEELTSQEEKKLEEYKARALRENGSH